MRWQSALQLALHFLFGALFGMGIERRRHSAHVVQAHNAWTAECEEFGCHEQESDRP